MPSLHVVMVIVRVAPEPETTKVQPVAVPAFVNAPLTMPIEDESNVSV